MNHRDDCPRPTLERERLTLERPLLMNHRDDCPLLLKNQANPVKGHQSRPRGTAGGTAILGDSSLHGQGIVQCYRDGIADQTFVQGIMIHQTCNYR